MFLVRPNMPTIVPGSTLPATIAAHFRPVALKDVPSTPVFHAAVAANLDAHYPVGCVFNPVGLVRLFKPVGRELRVRNGRNESPFALVSGSKQSSLPVDILRLKNGRIRFTCDPNMKDSEKRAFHQNIIAALYLAGATVVASDHPLGTSAHVSAGGNTSKPPHIRTTEYNGTTYVAFEAGSFANDMSGKQKADVLTDLLADGAQSMHLGYQLLTTAYPEIFRAILDSLQFPLADAQ